MKNARALYLQKVFSDQGVVSDLEVIEDLLKLLGKLPKSQEIPLGWRKGRVGNFSKKVLD